jgi:thiol-disulfide isomerase/thioredoxin
MPATAEPRRPSTRGWPLWLLVVAGVLLLARVGTGIWERFFPPHVPELVRWSAPTGVRPAADRPVLYDFTADWCQPCQKMKREVFAEPDAAAFINESFLPVRVLDTDESPGARELRQRHRVTGFPTLLVTLPDQSVRSSEGYSDRAATLKFLNEALAHWRK